MPHIFNGTIKERFDFEASNVQDKIVWNTVRIEQSRIKRPPLDILNAKCELLLPNGLVKITVWGQHNVYFSSYDNDGQWYIERGPRNPNDYKPEWSN